MTAYINNPKEIEKRSFEIITEELGGKTFPPEIADIVKRVIHTTADFEYADLIEFKNNAVESGLKALEAGKKIYADTSMIKVAVNRKHWQTISSKLSTMFTMRMSQRPPRNGGLPARP